MIKDFKRFCKQNLNIDNILKEMTDKRKRPQIKTSQIVWAIVNMVSLNIKSILELDQMGRLPQIRSFIGTKRPLVASDTTYDRVLRLLPIGSIREAIVKVYQNLQQQELDKVRLESGRIMRVAGIDASGFGRHLASVVSIFGKIDVALDIEMYNKRGKELPCSYRLISRLRRHLGKNFCDIMTADGLYKASKFFRLCKESGFDGLVKTKETRLEIIKDAQGLYNLKDDPSIERKNGFDLNRLCTYELEAVANIKMSGLRYLLKVVHVKEDYPKLKRQEDFFVITTRQDLTALEARELAHKRWQIENNIFKTLNQTITSKKVHTHSQKVLGCLLLLWYIGLALTKAFLFNSVDRLRQIFGAARQTFSIRIAYMRYSLSLGYG